MSTGIKKTMYLYAKKNLDIAWTLVDIKTMSKNHGEIDEINIYYNLDNDYNNCNNDYNNIITK